MNLSKVFYFFLSLLALAAVERFCHWQTGGFRMAKAVTSRVYPLNAPFASTPTSLPELDQSFYFLASGVQCYVFLGEDGKTILKLFKQYHGYLSTDLLRKAFPPSFTRGALQKREKRMATLFRSARIACENLSEETGVYFTHLQKTTPFFKTIKIYDKLGIPHTLDLDQTEFILQKRAEVAGERLHRLFKNDQVAEANKEMNELLDLIENRSRKGIKNKDGKIMHNCGFLGEKPVELDIGSFVVRSSRSHSHDPHKKARVKATRQLLSWVKKQYPQHFPFCKKELLNETSD